VPTESYPQATDWQNDCGDSGAPSANKFTRKNFYEGQEMNL
jgi:hypothetical protein